MWICCQLRRTIFFLWNNIGTRDWGCLVVRVNMNDVISVIVYQIDTHNSEISPRVGVTGFRLKGSFRISKVVLR